MSLRALNVVHVLTRLFRAGSEENTITTCLGQVEAGCDVTLLHGKDFDAAYGREVGDRVRLVRVPSLVHPISPVNDVLAVRDIARLLREFRADVVHTHQSKAGLVGRIAGWIARTPKIVHGVHIVPFLNISPAQRMVYLAAERAAARVTDAFIDVSAGMRDACLEAGVGRPDNHFVVYSGMDLDKFRNTAPPAEWREILGTPEGSPKPPVLLMLASLEPRKRQIPLIERFSQITARFPDARLLLAGEGHHRPAVQAAVEAAGLQENVRLLGFHPRPEELIALADICLLTSMREGLPRVVVQYLAGGKPAIVTRVPGIEEIVDDSRTGVITDPENFDDTIRAILSLLEAPDRLSAMSAAAAAVDVGRWEKDALVRGVDEVYRRIGVAA